MNTLEVLTLLLVVFAALTYIDIINLTLYKFPIVQPLDTPISFGFLI